MVRLANIIWIQMYILEDVSDIWNATFEKHQAKLKHIRKFYL